MKHKSMKNLFLSMAMIAVGFILPVVAFYLVISYDQVRRGENDKKRLKLAADDAAQFLQTAFNNRQYWCFNLNAAFLESEDAQEFESRLQKLKSQMNQDFQWLIWNKNNNVVHNTIDWNVDDAAWGRAVSLLKIAANYPDYFFQDEDDEFLRSIFGHHFELKAITKPTFKNKPDLIELNLFKKGKSLWADFGENFSAIAVFPPDIDSKKQGLDIFVNSYDWKKPSLVLSCDEYFFSSDVGVKPEYLAKLKKYFKSKAPAVIESETHLFAARFVGTGLFFCLFEEKVAPNEANKQIALFAICLAFIWILAANNSLSQQSLKVGSIKYVVVALVVCANIFPFLLISVLSAQYLEQKRLVLADEKRIEAINFLKRLETEFMAETHGIKSFAIKHINRLSETLKHEPLSAENSLEFRNVMAEVSGKFMIIASTTYPTVSDVAYLGEKESYIFDDKLHTLIKDVPYTKDNRLELNNTLAKCGAVFLLFYNGAMVPDRILMEVELISNVVFQGALHETYYKFLRLFDYVEKLGIGTEKHPTFMHFLSFNKENLADYIFMFYFNLDAHAQNFLDKNRTVLQGNMQGIKVLYAMGKNLKKMVIKPFTEEEKLRNFFSKLTTQPPTSANYIELNNETWVATGYVSSELADISLMTLSPTKEIDRILNSEKQELIVLLFLNAVLVFGIALVFVKTLLAPVNSLRDGALALKDRNFAHRIPILGGDEFAEMSQVLNTALTDLEEMAIARNVQQQLFPRQRVYTGDYDVFSKSITMCDLGGDYLDVIQLSETKFVMMLGDVAGHGVGAALIVAMAKSVMLNSKELLEKPKELLARLHDIIYRTKTKKQRKIMTFQYVMVDSVSHKVVFANAGGCNPFLIASNGDSREIVLPAPALGAFKRSSFSQVELTLNAGDTLVLYTDGFVEARNDAGDELGFGEFERMAADARCEGSEKFYNRIMRANAAWRGNQTRLDDYSLVILQRQLMKKSR